MISWTMVLLWLYLWACCGVVVRCGVVRELEASVDDDDRGASKMGDRKRSSMALWSHPAARTAPTCCYKTSGDLFFYVSGAGGLYHTVRLADRAKDPHRHRGRQTTDTETTLDPSQPPSIKQVGGGEVKCILLFLPRAFFFRSVCFFLSSGWCCSAVLVVVAAVTPHNFLHLRPCPFYCSSI